MRAHRCLNVLLTLGAVFMLLLSLPKTATATELQPGNAPGLPVYVDEPVGASNRYSLGMTMWHLRHSPEKITEFHSYVASRGYTKEQLIPPSELAAPDYAYQILLEPELLSPGQLDGWTVNGQFLHSTHYDAGPTVDFPLSIDRDGVYRLWVQYNAVADCFGVTRIRIYPSGQEAEAPILDDEFYDKPATVTGLQWKDMLIELAPGNYTVTLAHVLLASWHTGNTSPVQYTERNIDTIYLTDKIWVNTPPSEEEQLLLRAGSHVSDIQWTNTQSLSAEEKTIWSTWVLRPAAWEQREDYSTLFDLSYDFWRQEVDELAALDYVGTGNLPDYREPQRQIIVDDRWNMCGNPVLVQNQIDTLQSNISTIPPPYLHYRLYAGQFTTVTGDWYRDGEWLRATYGDFTGEASHSLTVSETDDYYVWVRIRNINYYEPYRITVDTPTDDPIVFNRILRYYSPPDGADAAWVRIGTISAAAGQAMSFSIIPLGYISPGTYRGIHAFEITNDPNFTPSGTGTTPSTPLHYRLSAGRFQTVTGDWYRDGEWLRAPYWDITGEADHALHVGRTTDYHVWVRIRNINYYEPYRITVASPHGTTLTFNRTQRYYTPTDGADAAWVKIGVISAYENDHLNFQIIPLGYISPGTYRGIHCIEVTTDANYTPVGTTPEPMVYLHYRKYAGQFTNVSGGWYRDNQWLRATYGDFTGEASQALPVDETNDYHVWARIKNINYHEPYRITVTSPHGTTLTFDRTQRYYTPADGADAAWVKIGIITANAGDALNISITPLGYISPGTYRGIHCFEVTTDPNCVPTGTAEYPSSSESYLDHAGSVGGNPANGYMAWLPGDPYTPLAQDAWPSSQIPGPSMQNSMSMAKNSYGSVAVFLRGLVADPLTLQVSPGSLTGAGGSYSHKVQWRVNAFTPLNESGSWTPFLLLRRPDITVPKYNVAGIWLTVMTDGVAPGEYTSEVTISTPGYPNQTLTLNVHVSSVEINPANPALASGWTLPPEGNIYREDSKRHGLNVWPAEMSKADMNQWGIRLLYLPNWANDAGEISARFQRLASMGVGTNDYVMGVMDEPCGTTQQALQPYIDIANTIHNLNANARVIFNPGEAATVATFQILDPYAQWWNPYVIHFGDQNRVNIFSAKPYLWYTTPCYWDKSPTYPTDLYAQFRSVPSKTGQIKGSAFFAFNYPFRDHWDTAYEAIADASVTVLPSRYGPVSARSYEALREGIQHGNLAQMVKEAPGGAGETTLINSGSVASLLSWLEGGTSFFYAGNCTTVTGDWYRDGQWLRAPYWDITGQASHSLPVTRTATHHVWARIRNIDYYEPYRITVTSPHGTTLIFNRTQRYYTPPDGAGAAWVDLGDITANSGDSLGFLIEPLGYISPGTYRGIHVLLATTDPNYQPSGAP